MYFEILRLDRIVLELQKQLRNAIIENQGRQLTEIGDRQPFIEFKYKPKSRYVTF